MYMYGNKIIVILIALSLVAGCQSVEQTRLISPSQIPLSTKTRMPSTKTPKPTDTFEATEMQWPTDTPMSLIVESSTITELDGIETLTDIDGNIYRLVKIGEQWWLAENLKVTRNPIGQSVLGYCYDNDDTNCDSYGRLYNWDGAMNGATDERAQGICPNGWHIPSDADGAILIEYLGEKMLLVAR